MSDDVPESTLGERIIEAFIEGHKKRKRLEEHEEQRFPHDVMNRINESMPAMLEGASNGCTRFEVKFQDKYKYFRFYVDHADMGTTVAITLASGDCLRLDFWRELGAT